MKYSKQLIGLSLGSILILSSGVKAEVIAITDQACFKEDSTESFSTFKEKQKEEEARKAELHELAPELASDRKTNPIYLSKEDFEIFKQGTETNVMRRVTLYKKKGNDSIHIDIQRPDSGKINTPTVYNASASKVPSGNIAYQWESVTGGLTFSDTDKATTTVTARSASNSGLNAFTKLTIRDTLCNISSSTQFNVNYKE